MYSQFTSCIQGLFLLVDLHHLCWVGNELCDFVHGFLDIWLGCYILNQLDFLSNDRGIIVNLLRVFTIKVVVWLPWNILVLLGEAEKNFS